MVGFKFDKKQKSLLILAFFLFVFIFWWTQPKFDQTGTIKIWDRNGTLIYELAGVVGKKNPVIYDLLPKHLVNAVVASEDITFWTNPGVDFKAIFRSAYLNLRSGKIVSGASTITQQLARISVISPQKIPIRNIVRKVREILIALRIAAKYSKSEVLTMYLNQMYFGNLSYGIQSASSTYFNKDVSQLSLAESTYLVGLLSSPNKQDPLRQSQVLDLMEKHGFITPETANDAKKEKLSLSTNNADIKAPHFAHYILQELDGFIINKNQGLNIYTTLDLPTFNLSQDVARIWVGRLKIQHDLSNASLVLINNNTGEILNMLGGIDYFDATHSGQVNMTTALRQPGSALKPVTYATAFLQGYTPATLIYDVKKVYKTKSGEGFTPNNYDGKYHGLVLAREALASSLNLPAVEMLDKVGINNFLKVARDLGIKTLTQEDRYDLSLTLGGGEVKLLELANIYASLARGGEYLEPYSIQKITTDNGKVLYEHKYTSKIQALGPNSKQVSYLISNILSDPKARIPSFGEKNSLVLSRSAAVKTGTTTDWHDNWTVGYTPSYTVGVWVGNNDNHPMREITGVVGAAPIWNQFFEEFLKGKPTENFIVPEKIKQVEVCAASGKLPDGLCPEKTTEMFIQGTEPIEISQLHKKVLIDTRNGLLAGESCPKSYIKEKVFIEYPSEVYTWAVQDQQLIAPREFSPLCLDSQAYSGTTHLIITYPKNQTVFETAPQIVNNQGIVFEVDVSPDIQKVIWNLDKLYLNESDKFPFQISWAPTVGNHIISAYGVIKNGDTIKSEEVNFNVVEFKDY